MEVERMGKGPGIRTGLENRRGGRRQTCAEGAGEQRRSKRYAFCVNFARDFPGEMLSLEIQLGGREPIGI